MVKELFCNERRDLGHKIDIIDEDVVVKDLNERTAFLKRAMVSLSRENDQLRSKP